MDENLKKSINDIVRNRRLYTASASTNNQEVVMADNDIRTLKALLRDSISMLRICVNLSNDSKSPYYGSVAGKKIQDAFDCLKEAEEKLK